MKQTFKKTRGYTLISKIKNFVVSLLTIRSIFSSFFQREKRISEDVSNLRLLIMNSKNHNIGPEW
ncbi:hypothetical protein ACE939_04000 [Aquimarina sp. W85]|uniref:hypothetical protein n=1 Tax=Aquimarina rhodophyticola TaxID=3342246 RepID=UPI003672A94E